MHEAATDFKPCRDNRISYAEQRMQTACGRVWEPSSRAELMHVSESPTCLAKSFPSKQVIRPGRSAFD